MPRRPASRGAKRSGTAKSTAAPKPTFTVRPATALDIPRLTSHRVALFQDSGELGAAATATLFRQVTRQAFVSGFRDGTCRAWIAESDSKAPLGSVAMNIYTRLPSPKNPTGREGYLVHLYTLAAWRRKGVASRLLDALIAEARRLSLRRIRLHATADGRPVYELYGFGSRSGDMELYL